MLLKRKSSGQVKGKHDYGRDARYRPGHQVDPSNGRRKAAQRGPNSPPDWRPGLTILVKQAAVTEVTPATMTEPKVNTD